MKRERKGLTLRQKRFVAEYVADFNATRAAIRAGYKASSADKLGSRLLHNPLVAEAIAEHHHVIVARATVAPANLLRELSLLAYSDISDYEVDERGRLRTRKGIDPGRRRSVKSFRLRRRVVSVETDGETTTTTSETELEIQLHDKLRALQLLVAYQGLSKRDASVDPLKEIFRALPESVRVPLRELLLKDAGPSGYLNPSFVAEPPSPTFDKLDCDVVVPLEQPHQDVIVDE